MKRLSVLASFAALLIVLVGVHPAFAITPSEARPLFQSGEFTDARGTHLGYRILLPENYDATKAYPLFIWLHGAGEVGRDNVRQIDHGVEVFATPELRAKEPAIVLVPQCPPGDRWTNMNSKTPAGRQRISPEPTNAARATFELIEKIKSVYAIDSRRVTLLGVSMGGFGVWDWIERRPDLFTSAVPMSGGGDTERVARAAQVRILAVHGDRDDAVDVSQTEVMLAALRSVGARPDYDKVKDCGHGDWEFVMQDPRVQNWLFAK